MKLPWQNTDDADTAPAQASEPQSVPETHEEGTPLPKGYTPPKGRPTPKRKEVEMERGVIRGASMAPTTPQQQRQRRKELKASMSKEEWKEYKRKEREESRRRQRETQAAMDRGEERYLLPRDKGPERAFARDWVDSRRFINNWVMPFALLLLLSMFVTNGMPQIAAVFSLVSMGIIIIFALEGIILGRRVNRAVRSEFPNTSQAGLGLGFYAYSRAMQPRRWRTPKPRVELGAAVGRAQ
ncbi:DUF3043 domain-containing protein [Corynebacterium lowii]|uniref:DUF3043 domain-containing protein n=1 Tax=Corynebacterium lowii TaxID=1544413 RepID=A0A0Q0YWP1_9CORY|nr:DUF3043 domain-containing protein [Corynebacterium lowii]KQB86792.1 hypothetical protein Clow_01000 [Corynebacterium lowii]MDP9851478.1 hypothetical protein [Corynebacterium lowii]